MRMETQPQIPLRILRAHAEALSPTRLTPRQQARQDRILLIASELIARFGRAAFSFSRLAQAMRYSTSTLRWHFADLDALVAHIAQRHVRNLNFYFNMIPEDAPDRVARLRAAYRASTRAPDGSLTAVHRLFLAERHTLPPEDLAAIEAATSRFPALLLPGLDPQNMALLDDPNVDPTYIDTLVTEAARAAAQTQIPESPPELTDIAPTNFPVPPRPATETASLEILRLAAPRPPLLPEIAAHLTSRRNNLRAGAALSHTA